MSEFEWDAEALAIAAGYAGRDFNQRKVVTAEAFSAWGSEEWGIEEFAGIINDAIAAIPAEARADAIVELEGGYDESTRLTIRYRRPETDAELNGRIARCREYVTERRNKDRADFERLKAKFAEPSPIPQPK